MSFKGEVEVRCPNGCEPFSAEVWSFIDGRKDDDLRLAVMFGECNMVLCPQCRRPFFADSPFVYLDARLELLAFVFPEPYKENEEHWRRKMHEDFAAMRAGLKELPLSIEPEIFFGPQGLATLLDNEEYRAEEREVMECLAKELRISLYEVSPGYARRHGIPSCLPYLGASVTPQGIIDGLEKIVAANDRLTAFGDYLKSFRAADTGLPPAAASKR